VAGTAAVDTDQSNHRISIFKFRKKSFYVMRILQ